MVPTSFEQAYERYYAMILCFFVRRGYNQQAAEDATQEVFCRAWRARQTLDVISKQWLYRVASNYLTDQWRRTRNAEHCELTEELMMMVPDHDDELHALELEMQLDDSMRGLKERYRIALRMDLDGCGKDEIAEALQVSLPAVKTLVHRAKQHTRARWIELEEVA